MEYLDVCDQSGQLTGEKVTKIEAHQNGVWHRSVHIWIVNHQNEILFQRRSPLIDNYPDKWDISAAGHVSSGESYLQAAIRETREELGLDFVASDFVLIAELTQQSARTGYINREVNPVYLIKTDLVIDKIKKQAEEVADVRLLTLADFEQMIKNADPDFVPHEAEYRLVLDYLRS